MNKPSGNMQKYLRNQKIKQASVWLQDVGTNIGSTFGIKSVAQKSFTILLLIGILVFVIIIAKQKAQNSYLWSQQTNPVYLTSMKQGGKPYFGGSSFNYKGNNFIPLQSPVPGSYSLGFWLKINSNEYSSSKFMGQEKRILNIGPNVSYELNSFPSISLNPTTNLLTIQFKLNSSNLNAVEYVRIPVPLDTWINYYVVCSNQYIELYVNGLLETTKAFGAPIATYQNPNMYIGPDTTNNIVGFPGNLAFVSYHPQTKATADDVLNNYNIYKAIIDNPGSSNSNYTSTIIYIALAIIVIMLYFGTQK